MKKYKCHRDWKSIEGDVNAPNVVYTLTHTSGRVYVGKTTVGFRKRYGRDLVSANQALHQYAKSEFAVVIEPCIDAQDAKELESELIQWYRDNKLPLFNDRENAIVGPLEGMELEDVDAATAQEIDRQIEWAFRVGMPLDEEVA